jgi:formylglycine-generating enzyme required for sulfatase activity
MRNLIRLVILLLAALLVGPIPTRADKVRHEMVRIDAPRGAFAIDLSEVTVGQFRVFARATAFVSKAEREGGGSQFLGGWRMMPGWVWHAPYGKPAGDREPVAHVTFDEAAAYCRWAGLRLPTDAEWVEAAYTERRAAPPAPLKRGETYLYPSGPSPDGANQTATAMQLGGFTAPAEQLGQGRGALPVGATPPGVNGLLDMGGNLWEWVDHDEAGQKRTRGGSWWYGPAQMRADALYAKPRDFPAVYIGFRCAGDPAKAGG